MTSINYSLRKLYLPIFFTLLLLFSKTNVLAQCAFGGSQYPSSSVATPTTNGTTATVSTCNYYGEYSNLTGFTAGNLYTLTVQPSGYITVFNTSNVAIAWGNSPLNFTPPASGTYNVKWTNVGCTTDATCHTTSVTLVGASTPMTYTSSTVTQSATSSAQNCSSNIQILGLEVVVSGATSPISVTGIQTNFTGTAAIAGISASRIYYTGTSNVFATSTLFGSGTPSTSNYTISGSQSLSTGTNYFWLVYDLNTAATAGTTLDASITQFTLSATNYTPSVTAPAGNRSVIICNAPGGVNSGLQTWLRADMGTSGGANVSSWTNQASGGVATNIQGNPPIQISNSSYNYNRYIDFQAPAATLDGGVNSTRQCILLNGYNDINGIDYKSVFFTFQLNDLSRTYTHCATVQGVTTGTPANGTWHGDINGTQASILWETYDVNDFGTSAPAGTWQRNGVNILSNSLHSSQKHILSAVCQTGGSTTLNAFLGGQNDQTPASSFTGHVRDWKGPAAEIIGFTNALTAVERQKVHTYLAIKYGITLTSDYLNTNGGTIFTTASPYNNNIIGIGRDDVESLNQRQSHYDNDMVRLYISTLQNMNENNTGVFGSDVSYVVIGDNNGAHCTNATALAEMPSGLTNCLLYSRLEKEWKVMRTNNNQTFNMDILLSPCGAPSSVTPSDLRLLVDDDGNFANGGTQCYYNGDGTGIVLSYTNPYITVSNVSAAIIPNGTKYLTIASVNAATPLPVELLQFNAKLSKNERSVDLTWSTETEHNSDYFEVQKLAGQGWSVLDNIGAAGESEIIQHYYTVDFNPVIGVNYYRLKQVDKNGEATYSDIRAVALNPGKELMVFPNPAQNFVQLIQKDISKENISLIDEAGRIIAIQPEIISDDTILLDTQNIANGVYLIRAGAESKMLKLIVQH